MVKQKWTKRYFSKVQANTSVTCRLILSELIVLVKTKLKKNSDGTSAKKLKRRLLLNL